MSRIYLDHAATTPMVPEAVEAMTRELTRVGNASSLHASGRSARRVVEESREAIAAQVGASPAELIFTSGGTESDNLAIKGAFWSGAEVGRHRVITSTVEHHAVLDSVAWLGHAASAKVSYIPADSAGRTDLSALTEAVDSETALVSVMWGNNEVGTLQPVRQIAAIAGQHGAISHSDAVQAVGHIEVDFASSGLDLLSFTAHKLGGPYGIGALLARREVRLAPILHGGGQERDVRSGTLDVAATAGFAAALEVATKKRVEEERRIRELRTDLLNSVLAAVPWAIPYGPTTDSDRLPGHREHWFSRLFCRRHPHAARCGGDRLFNRSGMLGRRLPAEPCADGHGLQQVRCAISTQVLTWPQLDLGRRTGARRSTARCRTAG